MEWYLEKGKWLGFDDGVFTYRVAQDDNGWYFEHIHDLDGMDGYDTAEEAKLAAEADYRCRYSFSDDFEMEIDSDLLEELATEAEAELQGEGLEIWMNSNIFTTYRSDWE